MIKENNSFKFNITTTINESVITVFATLTSSNLIVKWYYPDEVLIEKFAGGKFIVKYNNCEFIGSVLNIEEPFEFERIEPIPYDFNDDLANLFDCIILITLNENENESTNLIIKQSGFPSEEIADREKQKWYNLYIPQLQKLCNNKSYNFLL